MKVATQKSFRRDARSGISRNRTAAKADVARGHEVLRGAYLDNCIEMRKTKNAKANYSNW
jgi:hypothetical protein